MLSGSPEYLPQSRFVFLHPIRDSLEWSGLLKEAGIVHADLPTAGAAYFISFAFEGAYPAAGWAGALLLSVRYRRSS
jgi:hypothetical protein